MAVFFSMMANGTATHKHGTMKAILTFDNKSRVVVDIITLPEKPVFVEQIERELMDNLNAQLTATKVIKVHLLRN